MTIEIVPYSPDLLPLVRRFADSTWKRPRTAAQIRWRYEEAPDMRAFLAISEGACVAMVRAHRHHYRIDDSIEPFLETFDWYKHPDAREPGLGARVMQRCMEEPDSLLQVGGTPAACASLERLGWKRVCTGQRFVLPLASGVASAIERRLHLPRRAAAAIARGHARIAGPRRPRAPAGARVIPVAGVGAEVHALYSGPTRYRTLALWSAERLRWVLFGHPAAGHFVPLYFARGESLLGWALLRIHANDTGCAAELVDLLEPRGDRDLYEWMIAELARVAAGFGAAHLGATSTCPAVVEALRRNRFRPGGEIPVHAWLRGRSELPGPQLLGSNTRDTPVNPFPEHWWGEEMAD